MEKAIVTNIQGYSIHDGPGIRTVVFLKGCPLRCRWCANPENLTAQVEVGFLERLCAHCGKCAALCPDRAILPGEGVHRIHRSKCTRCTACVDACFYGALVRYGEEMTAQAAFDKVRRDKMFYDTSGGGVTASGGEPLVYAPFVAELFALCHEDGINTCVETCGGVPREAFDRILPVTDYVYFDLKHMDDAVHRAYTGVSNEGILANARHVVAQGANVLFRQPLIPGVNNTVENIRQTAAFMRSLGAGGENLQLMPYHRAGKTKYDALEMVYEMEDAAPMAAEDIEAVRAEYIANGVNCTISK